MNTVYELWHFKILDGEVPDMQSPEQSAKDIGVYSTEAKAQAAMARVQGQPGFRDWPAGFRIIPMPLDQDQWRDGFVP